MYENEGNSPIRANERYRVLDSEYVGNNYTQIKQMHVENTRIVKNHAHNTCIIFMKNTDFQRAFICMHDDVFSYKLSCAYRPRMLHIQKN